MRNKKVLIVASVVMILTAGFYIWSTVKQHNQGLPPQRPRFLGSEAGRPGAAPVGEQRQQRPQAPPPSAPSGPARGFSPPSREEGQRMFEQMAKDINLTEEQKTRFQEAFSGNGPPDREAIREILTPEQREQLRERMGRRFRQGGGFERMMERFGDRISEEDRKALRRRFEEFQKRRAQWDGRGPGRRRPPQEEE